MFKFRCVRRKACWEPSVDDLPHTTVTKKQSTSSRVLRSGVILTGWFINKFD